VTQVVPPRRVGDDHRNPRIQILRPELPPVTAAPATPDIPPSGTIQWALELRKGDVEVLSGSQLSSGRLMSGQELPGVPIAVSIQPPGAAGVVEAPSPGNGWKTLRLRGLRDGRIVITIQWRRL
jgi:hypothetical protein